LIAAPDKTFGLPTFLVGLPVTRVLGDMFLGRTRNGRSADFLKTVLVIKLSTKIGIFRIDMSAENGPQQGVAYANTVAEAMNLKLDADNPADREKLRRAVLDLVAGRKMPKQKGRG